MLKAYLKVLRNSFIMQIKDKAVEDFFITTLIFQPVVFTLLTVGIYLYGGKPDFGLFAVIGTGMLSIWNNNMWASGNIVRNERRGGTLPLVMASPTELPIIIFGKSLANSVTSILAMSITFLTGIIFFDIQLGIEKPLGFVIGLVLTVAALTCMGLVLGTVFVITRHGMMMNVANYPIYLLSGLTVPLTLLPYWVKPFSDVLAPKWGNIALNQAAGVMDGDMTGTYLWLVGLSVFYLIVARFLYQKVEQMARHTGTLEMW